MVCSATPADINGVTFLTKVNDFNEQFRQHLHYPVYYAFHGERAASCLVSNGFHMLIMLAGSRELLY